MSTILHTGSSEHSLREAPPEPSPEVKKKLDELAIDEPLPEVYGRDYASFLIQSPYRAYLYWEFARDPFATLRRAFGPQADTYRIAVRLTDTESGEEYTAEASPFARNFWFGVRPDRPYRAFVGLMSPGRPFIRLLSSRLVRTPRASVATRSDSRAEFRIPSIDFARALNYAGFTEDAIGVGLEGRDEASGNQTTTGITREWAHTDFTAANDTELNELRALLAALASGANLAELRASLSDRLARLLDELLATLDPERLRQLLRGALDLEINPLDSSVVSVRPLWGASEQHLPVRTFRLTTRHKLPPPLPTS